MGTETKKVKVTNQIWIDGITKIYPDKIDNDNIVLVEDYPDAEETDYVLVGTRYGISKTDCEVVEEELPEINEDKELKQAYKSVAMEKPKVSLDLTKEECPEPKNPIKYFMQDYYDPMLAKMKNEEEFLRMNNPIDGVYQFDKEKLERLNKMQKPTESPRSETIEITVDKQTYFINRKAWELEKELRKYRNQLFEGTLSQGEYDLIIKILLP